MNNNKNTNWHRTFILFIAFFTSLNVLALDETTPPPPSQQNQWEAAGYSESTSPITEDPSYRPLKRVLVSHSNPDIIKSMSLIMPDVEFVSSEQMSGQPNNFDAILTRCSQPNIIEKAPNAAWIHTYSAGVDSCLKLPEIQNLINRDQGLILTNSSGTAAAVIAEHTIGMMMTMTRGLHRYRDLQNTANWNRNISREPQLMQTINGKTMLVLGLGTIGQEIAKRANALGMKVIATRNSSRNGPDYVDYVGLSDETIELAKTADVVVNALPLTDTTRGFVDEEFFTAMKSNSYYISIGRGATTDTQALMVALESKKLAGAALDVTNPEPLPKDHPLWQFDNVIITPHISGTGGESTEKTVTLVLENLRRYQTGEPMLNIVDTNLGY